MPWFSRKKKPSNSLSPKRREVVKYSRRKQLWDRVRGKLSNLAFITTHPKKTLEIRRVIQPYYVRRAKLTAIKHELSRQLQNAGLKPVAIFSRTKTTKSLAEKIGIQKRPAEKVLDEAIGLRIIVRNKLDCYKISDFIRGLGTAENVIKFQDYIEKPRVYGYRAIHIVTNYFRYPVEIQIRSVEMEKEIAELDSAVGRFTNALEKQRRKELDRKSKDLEEAVRKISENLGRENFEENINFAFASAGLPNEILERVARMLFKDNVLDTRTFRLVLKRLKKSKSKK